MQKIKKLSLGCSHLLSGSRTISSVFSVVKELVENSLDAGSSTVEIRLENSGLDKIEVRDNGVGINRCDAPFVAKPHFTSKIACEDDLRKLETYGFRGEALSALCAVSEVSITTKTEADEISTKYAFDKDGNITSSKPFSSVAGTCVTVENLFKVIPVRKQFYKSEKNKKDELKRVEDVIYALACARIEVRFALYHNKSLIWQKSGVDSKKSALIQVLGHTTVENLDFKSYNDDNMQIEAFFPKKDAPAHLCSRSTTERCFILINKRPVHLKEIEKLLQECYSQYAESSGKNRYPVCVVYITLSPSKLDVNLDPNKTEVFLHDSDDVLKTVSEFISSFVSSESSSDVNNFNKEKLNVPECASHISSDNPQVTLQEKPIIISERLLGNEIRVAKNLDVQKENVAVITENCKIREISECINHIQNVNCNDFNSLEHLRNKQCNQEQVEMNSINLKNVTRQENLKEGGQSKLNALTDLTKKSETIEILPLKTVYNFPEKSKNAVETIPQVPLKAPKSVHSTIVPIGNKLIPDFLQKENVRNNSYKESIEILPKSLCDSKTNYLEQMKMNNNDAIKRDSKANNLEQVKANNNNLIKKWTCGLITNSCEENLQPVKVHQPFKRTMLDCNESTVKLKKLKQNNNSDKTQFEQGLLTAFDLFCRDNRLEVAAENPDCMVQDIAKILTDMWNKLPAEKKSEYKELALKHYQKGASNKKQAKSNSPRSVNRTDKQSTSSPNIKINEIQKTCLKEKNVNFHIEFLLECSKEESFMRNHITSLPLSPISCLSSGVWICCQNDELVLLNSCRIQEMLLYYRLLETYHLKTENVQVPYTLSISDAGTEENWHTLLSLKCDEYNCINDVRLRANGFVIKLTKGDCQVIAEIIEMTSNLPGYNVSDLKEILNLMQNAQSPKLFECRPMKVLHFLQSEAVRISRQELITCKKEDVEDLLLQMKNVLPADCKVCFHQKPIFQQIHNISRLEN